ncbi:Branched-chain amino acid transport system carrier protein [Planococcus halocryophilus Or1]|uniref:Branched-chain amino acid transport system carrier protein n=1 Tax=Planococcus halocryophilus TaxID=1215089 RepID=A0A1C7DUA7_9BACL|nr:branched-chain amino acid transport system II carrier protein [Planococcus halocryophilus]ANU14861.1 branched-chain amino acid transport system II carrier protein [Planococcus halocryophilus]EMF45235.1 Branched-chain amino acid transport system carrier protein [Planococcus halocryophilus Or1]
MDSKLSFKSYAVVGMMLFALFFGAGNLIFPAQLGQYAGTNVWLAIFGFLITGVGLPLLGILAIGYSKSDDLQDLSSRVHPVYGLVFTAMLYLTIGPFFALPRTGAVSYEVGVAPFIGDGNATIGLLIFSLIFFGVSLLVSLNPTKIVDSIGKILSPAILVTLGVLLVAAFVKPMGSQEAPQPVYTSGAFFTGFTEGYNTMDALASLVFGIIVISAVRKMGVTSSKGVLMATMKSGIVASALLAIVYTGIAYLGSTSTAVLGVMETGGPVLSGASNYYFGTFGATLLAVIIILACLTTAIGLTVANAEFFHKLTPKVSYKMYVIIFSVFSLVVTNAGLSNIITYSIPVLMFLYPLAIVLIMLAFLSPLFKHAQLVYVSTIIVTFFISIIDGFKTLTSLLGIENPAWLQSVVDFYSATLPLYNNGLGWLLPAIVVIAITTMIARSKKNVKVQAAQQNS